MDLITEGGIRQLLSAVLAILAWRPLLLLTIVIGVTNLL
jgi:hypothetical protein